MEIIDNFKLETLITKKNQLMEKYAIELNALNAVFAPGFAINAKRKKNLKWGIFVTIALTFGFIAYALISEMPKNGLYGITTLWVLLVGFLFFLYKRNEKVNSMHQNEYNIKFVNIEVYLNDAKKMEEEAKEEVFKVICLTNNHEVLINFKSKNSKDLYTNLYNDLLENTKEEILSKLKNDNNNSDIIKYYKDWKENLFSNSEIRDFRKEKIEYLNRKENKK